VDGYRQHPGAVPGPGHRPARPAGRGWVRELAAALAEGLAAIHDCGLIHRDLKPGNVILADDGPRIIDFGIAKGADATALTGSSAVIGTLRYMSPEQLNGQELTLQSDIFALGTVLAYAATRARPERDRRASASSRTGSGPCGSSVPGPGRPRRAGPG
jgi:serine/threonine protein kinase